MNPFAEIGRALEFRPGDALASGTGSEIHEAAFRRFCANGVSARHGGVSFLEILG